MDNYIVYCILINIIDTLHNRQYNFDCYLLLNFWSVACQTSRWTVAIIFQENTNAWALKISLIYSLCTTHDQSQALLCAMHHLSAKWHWYQKHNLFFFRSLGTLLTVPKREKSHSGGCASSEPKHECNFVVKDYRDLCFRLLPGQTRAKVNRVQCYFSARRIWSGAVNQVLFKCLQATFLNDSGSVCYWYK